MAKMKRLPFQNKGQISVFPEQNICFDVSGPFPSSVQGNIYSLNAICKATLSGGGKEVKLNQKLLISYLSYTLIEQYS